MEHLIRGVREAVASECWYAALSLGLMIPDACAAIESPGPNVGERYRVWTDTWLGPHVTLSGSRFLNGGELYRLRCRFLHEGTFCVDRQRTASEDRNAAMFEALNEFNLFAGEVVPSRNMVRTAEGSRVYYSVAVADLCEWICLAAEAWLLHARRNADHDSAIERRSRIFLIDLDGSRFEV